LKTPDRLLELDCLRGIAALSVVLFHFTFGYDYGNHLMDPSKFYFTYGRMGVQLFFIISGFVIFMTLSKTKNIFNFIITRFSRLYPAYWICILLTILITTLISPPVHIYSIKQVLFNFTMFQSAFFVKDIDGAYWTLFVELSFYIVMGLLFKFNQLKNIQLICFGWLLLCLLFYFFKIPLGNYIKVLLLLRQAPLFISGIGFYFLFSTQKMKSLYLILLGLSSYLIIIQEYKPEINELIILLFIHFSMYLFVIGKLKFIILKPFLFLGKVSYPLYLIHEEVGSTIIFWLKKVLDFQIFYVPITITLVTFLAFLIHKYVEKPSLVFIRSYFLKLLN
jgi:peptidoglycan/LPS O-acetylase OafA/YrhL